MIDIKLSPEDILNLENARDILFVKRDSTYEGLEILTINSIIRRFEQLIPCASCPEFIRYRGTAKFSQNCATFTITKECKYYDSQENILAYP